MKDDSRILDIGCGIGRFWEDLFGGLQNIPVNYRKNLIGVDFSYEDAKKFKQRIGAGVIVADARNLPFKKLWDYYVVCEQMIEHVEYRPQFLQEIKRVMAQGSELRISSVVKKRWAWYFYRTKQKRWGLSPEHCIEYDSVKDFLAEIRGAEGIGIRDVENKMIWYPICFWRWLKWIKVPIIGFYYVTVRGVIL